MKPKQLFKARSFSLETLNEDYVIPVGKVYCVGRNYSDHAVEMNESIEKIEPFFFTKPPQSLTQNNKIPFPKNTNNLHHEVELVVLIGSECQQVRPSDVEKMILGYAVGLDLTKRDLQEVAKDNKKPWDLSKGFDNSAPVSLVNISNKKTIKKGKIQLKINGTLRQLGDISEMIWSISELVSYLSNHITLYPGDVLFTGTPAGVGEIKPGDRIEASIENVGSLEIVIA
ncbi:fumarylacetoacetate hydrolase family protein [Gammaproteobacteria bacterium]|nr:fumarylacetoacetate hydrolase family protein [Gammaproteobacteria bacterium]